MPYAKPPTLYAMSVFIHLNNITTLRVDDKGETRLLEKLLIALPILSMFVGFTVGFTLRKRKIESREFRKLIPKAVETIVLVLVFLIGVESSQAITFEGLEMGVLAIILGIFSALMSSLAWEACSRGARK